MTVKRFAFKSENKKQMRLYEIWKACMLRKLPVNQVHMGGSIRGGKTYGVACMIVMTCLQYPNSKHLVVRGSLPNLKTSTIPSFEKIIGTGKKGADWQWHRTPGDYYAYHKNGSKIYFSGQKFDEDKECNWLKGAEFNTIFLEQMEEIEEEFYKIALSRVGSWILPYMPKGILFGTFNPTQNFVKSKIYIPYSEGKLPDNIVFIETSPYDNPYNTDDQYAAWEQMDERSKAIMIRGSWDDFDAIDGKWLWAFTTARRKQIIKPVTEMKINLKRDIIVAFDFNNEPFTALFAQINNVAITDPLYYIKVFDAIQVSGKDVGGDAISKLCAQINDRYKGCNFIVTGDAAGNQADLGGRDANAATNWQIVTKHLKGIIETRIPKTNIRFENTRPQCNIIFEKANIMIADHLTLLIQELDTAKVDVKKPHHYIKNRINYKMDLFDCLRYIFANCCRGYLEVLHKS